MAVHIEGRSPVARYGFIYQAFLDAGVPLVILKPGEKRPPRRVRDCRFRSLYEIEAAMDWSGANLGAVTHSQHFPGTNPLGFVNLDIDKPGDPLDLSRFTYMVRRSGETERAQYWFRIRKPLEPFKAFYGGGKGVGYDLATWNVVMPGSTKGRDSHYELWVREGGVWVLWDGHPFGIDMLPTMDLEDFLPQVSEEVPSECPLPHANVVPLARRSAGKKPRMRKQLTTVWVPSTGSEATLHRKATYYLRRIALPSISGQGGHTALFVVVANLRLYFKRSLRQTIDLIRKCYDHKCLNLFGEQFPWSDNEILHKFNQAGLDGVVTTLGVKDPKAKRKAAALKLKDEVQAFLDLCTSPGGSVGPSALQNAFIAHRGGESIGKNAFGRALTACGCDKRIAGGSRDYLGFHLVGAHLGLTNVGNGMCVCLDDAVA